MTGSGVRVHSSSGGGLLAFVFLILAFAGMIINVYLLSWKLADGGIAGCGGGSCEQVLASRWAVIFGMPITVFGVLTYAGLMVSFTRRGRQLTMPLLGTVFGAVVWFVFAQAILIGKLCPWCIAAHGVGIAVCLVGLIREWRVKGLPTPLKDLLWWGCVAFLTIGLMQVYGPVPTSHRIEDTPTLVTPSPIQARGHGRKVLFDDGRKSFDLSSLPRMGSPDAKHVMVEYFDFQCPSCRVMGGYLSALLEKHPTEICVLLMPVPLDPVCNESLVSGDVGHPNSCELTRIALAVWRVNSDAYPVIHRAFLADPPLKMEDALLLARKHVDSSLLEAAMGDPWIDELVAANIADWVSYSGKTKQLPKLLIRGKRILHGLPSGEADFIRAIEKELGR